VTTRKSKTPAEQVAERIVKQTRAKLGPGWDHVSQELRRGLVSTALVNTMLGQPATVSAQELVDHLRELVNATDALIGAEE
jgi:hypothetical protein